MNRVAAHIEKMQAIIDAGGNNGALDSPEKIAAFEKSQDVEPDEHFAYQQMQAEAHVSGMLSADEAMIVYVALGEIGSESNGGWAKGTNLATKVTVTNLMGQLLTSKLAGRR